MPLFANPDSQEQQPRHRKPVIRGGKRQGRYGNNLWCAWSPKLQRLVHLHSDLEYHHWILVEANPDIITFCEQPVKMRAHVDGRDRASIVDMWAQWRDGIEEYREIKYLKDMATIESNPDLRRQLDIQRAWCSRHKMAHAIFTEKQIFAKPLFLKNWKLVLSLLSSARVEQTALLEDRAQRLIADKGSMSLRDLLGHFPSDRVFTAQSAIFRLVHRGHLAAPLAERELTLGIEIRARHV